MSTIDNLFRKQLLDLLISQVEIKEPVKPITRPPMDPALKKLMDELPEEDPDKEMVLVWTAYCNAVHWIPIGEWVRLDFGEWLGPSMSCYEVKIHYRYKHMSGFFHPSFPSSPYIDRGQHLEMRMIVNL